MYEMQGPRFGRSVQTRRLPRRAGPLGQSAFLCSVRPPPVQEPRKVPGHPLSPVIRFPVAQKTSARKLAARKLCVPRSCLWGGYPFSLVESFLLLRPSQHKTFWPLISRFFGYPPIHPPFTPSCPQRSKLSTAFIHSGRQPRARSEGLAGRARPAAARDSGTDEGQAALRPDATRTSVITKGLLAKAARNRG